MKNRYAVIMAGGSGTRFWPKSSGLKPKQLLALTDPKRSQLQLTWDRLKDVVKAPQRWVVGTEFLKKEIKKQIKGIHVLAEPEGRNTMAAVCWSAWAVAEKNPDAMVAILPADAFIADIKGYQATLELAFNVAQKEDRIVCLGIKPTFAATGYGYIQAGDSLSGGAKTIARFIEKPDDRRARELYQSGQFFWNAGIFVFPCRLLQDEVRKYAPEFAAIFDKYRGKPQQILKLYKKFPKVPFDVALMEKTQKGALVPGQFGWNDIGSWPALSEVLKPNSSAGVINAEAGHVAISSSNLVVDVTSKKFVGVIGVSDLVIVETETSLLVCHRDKAQQIKDLVTEIEKNPKLKKRLL